jgi:hypothetical protein
LAAYAESLIDARRVLVYGDASSGLAEHLLARGARSVHVFDQDSGRVAEALARNTARNVSFAPLDESGMALREGAFDVALVENLASVGNVELALKSIKRTLSTRGAAFVASANPDVDVTLLSVPNLPKIAIDYYSLYDAVAEEFEHVRMLGQTPFVGYAIADFAPDAEPLPALDTGFVPGGAEEPEWFIALASQHPLLLDEFSVIQLPFSATWSRVSTGKADERLNAARAAERRARQRLETLESENRRLSRGGASVDESEQLERLRQELARRDGWIEQLEARCAAADARADHAESELEAEREKHLDLTLPNQEELDRQIQSLQEQLQSAKEQLDAATTKAGEREQELTRLRQREAKLEEQLDVGDPESEREIESLERQLQERGQELLRVSGDLRKLEQLSRNLIGELEEFRNGETEDELSRLREQLDQLASMNACREADLVALHWTVTALEGRLEALNPEHGLQSPA